MDSEISGKLRVKDYFQSALYREKKMILIGMLPSFLLIYVVLPEDVSLAFSIFLYVVCGNIKLHKIASKKYIA